MDIVLYEKDFCPVYSVNRDPSTTYYPCEGVIAVGEIKSRITSEELEDIFNKIASVKRLRRYTRLLEDPLSNELGLEDTFSFPKIRLSTLCCWNQVRRIQSGNETV